MWAITWRVRGKQHFTLPPIDKILQPRVGKHIALPYEHWNVDEKVIVLVAKPILAGKPPIDSINADRCSLDVFNQKKGRRHFPGGPLISV